MRKIPLRTTLRWYFERHPLQKSLARPFYRGLKTVRGFLPRRRAAADSGPRGPTVTRDVRNQSVPVLAVVARGFYGVTTSTLNNFPNVLLEDRSQPGDTAQQILDGGYQTVVFSGMPKGFDTVARTIGKRSPATRLLVHYHGSLVQNADPFNLDSFKSVVRLAREGVVERVGCAKAGVAPVFRSIGMEASYLPYRIEPPEAVEHRPAASPRRIGVFVRDTYRKNAHTQFAAAALVRDAEIHANELPDLSYLGGSPTFVPHGNLPHEEFLGLLGRMDVTFYVSLSECYPMVVLESLIRGVPCVTSRTHEIFAHDEELGRKLIVNALDNPAAVARRAEAVLADREAID
ncbi:MAG: hypothetical protein ACYS1C_11515 [Planctomycetota bacterium]|jgi:hypothetical protein